MLQIGEQDTASTSNLIQGREGGVFIFFLKKKAIIHISHLLNNKLNDIETFNHAIGKIYDWLDKLFQFDWQVLHICIAFASYVT